MLRRLHPEQPDSFAFTDANKEWAQAQIAKYPEGRQASAVIPLLWRAQEQEGWVSRPIIETVADMLGMAHIRVLEVASFYFMFQLAPVGSVAHVQVCGTTSCMICGAEDLISVCKDKIAAEPHALSADGKFSWEEVECLGACSNAPMVQIGKDYYEDLTAESFAGILDAFARGEVPRPGPQNGRWASEPLKGLTSLDGDRDEDANGSVALAIEQGDTIARITGTQDKMPVSGAPATPPSKPKAKAEMPEETTGVEASEIHDAEAKGRPDTGAEPDAEPVGEAPQLYSEAPDEGADDLKKIKGVGPKLEETLNSLGVYRFEQIAGWTEANIAWVDEHLNFKGRVERDDWIAQAKALMEGDA